MGQSPSSVADSHSASHEILHPHMKPEGSLVCSEEATTCPYPEPDSSSPHLHSLFPQDPF